MAQPVDRVCRQMDGRLELSIHYTDEIAHYIGTESPESPTIICMESLESLESPTIYMDGIAHYYRVGVGIA